MKNYEFLVADLTLLLACGAAQFTIGRCYWRRANLMKWALSLISSTVVVAATVFTLLVYIPSLVVHLDSPLNLIIILMAIAGLSAVYRRIFVWGDRTGQYIPDPNNTYEIDDLPPMPTK